MKKKNKITQNITYNESKRNKINNENDKQFIVQINIVFLNNMDFNDFFQKIKNELNNIIEDLKNEIITNKCVLMQFNEIIDSSIINKMILFIANRVTGLSLENLLKYFKNNFYPLNDQIINIKNEEITKFIV